MPEKLNLQVGSMQVKMNKYDMGQIGNPSISLDTSTLQHSTNRVLPYRTNAVYALGASASLGGEFHEWGAKQLNVLMGMQGFSAPTRDPRLGGSHRPEIDSSIRLVLSETEYPQFRNLDKRPVWAPLTYKLASPNSQAPDTPDTVSLLNTSPGVTVLSYRMITAALLIDLGAGAFVYSIPAPIQVVEVYNATTDTIAVTLKWDPLMNPAPTDIQIYMYAAAFNSTFDQFIGTFAAASVWDFGAAVLEDPLTAPEIAAGEATRVITSNLATLDVSAGLPVNPLVVTDANGTVMDWLDDYEYLSPYEGGSAVRRVPGGGFTEGEYGKAIYTYRADKLAEIPLGPIDSEVRTFHTRADILLPDRESKIIVDFWAGQVVTSARLNPNETGFGMLPFSINALDRQALYQNYPFGKLQAYGPLWDEIMAEGNPLYGFGQNADTKPPYHTKEA